MSKRRIAWIVIALLGVISTAGMLLSMFGTTTLVFSESDIQTRVNEQLPKTVRELTIERVAVHFQDNRLMLQVNVNGTILRQPITAAVSAQGVPRYAAQNGEMYFDADDVKIDQLTIAGRNVAGDDDTARRRLTEAAHSTARSLAETAIKTYLATRPVYRFKDNFKGIVLKASLVNVKIEQNSLAVTVSLWNLTMTVAMFALVIIIVLLIIYLLIRHPLWGLDAIANIADLT